MKTIAIANQDSKTCSKCLKLLPVEQFALNKNQPSGRYPACKNCENQRQRRLWKRTQRAVCVSSKLCLSCKIEKLACEFPPYRMTKDGLNTYCRACKLAKEAERRKRLRQKLIAGYGGICACCGESHVEFLSLDHVHGGGRKDSRRLSRNMHVLWTQIIKANFPKDYRLLCWNCNSARGVFGYCPHEKDRELAA